MRIFVAGATGAIGRLLVPRLLAAGHQVTGTSRTERGATRVRESGADAVIADAFDRAGLYRALRDSEPDVVVHQLTALSEGDLAANSRIRVEGTRNLVDAARAAGVTRMIAQSISWAYEPGTGPADERTPLDLGATGPRASTVAGVRALEEAAAELPVSVVLRCGTLYGPGTWYFPGELMARQLSEGRLEATEAVSSFLHVEDAAAAASAALGWPSGAVNVVDDEPAPASEWVPVLAKALGQPQPVTNNAAVPGWARGASNAFARHDLGWSPVWPSWRAGFPTLD
jgi:nucleoside-diphosphate-sugar epimerase